MEDYDPLKLENQLCFPLYACSKEIVRRYKPFLDELDLTYTQYIAMLVFWEKGTMNVKELGEKLYLDSGTLTPLLKKLQAKGYISRERSKDDERYLVVKITQAGMALKDKALNIPQKMNGCFNLDIQEMVTLKQILVKMLAQFSVEES